MNNLVKQYKNNEYKPTGIDYELYLLTQLNSLGYKAYKTKATGDQGADLIININPYFRIAIQCKYYSNNLDNTPVQEIIGAMKYYNAQMGVVITNKDFTKGARNLATINNIMLVNHFDFGSDINRIIKLFGFAPTLEKIEREIDSLKLQLNSVEAENQELINYIQYMEKNKKSDENY